MKNFEPIVEKYAKIKKTERLDYTQLRQRLEQDKFQKYQIKKILAKIYQQQENKRIGYHKKINIIYPFAFGLILIGASVYFYQLGDGMNLMEKSKGTGWNEYRYLIGMVILLAAGIFLMLHGWNGKSENRC